MDAVGIGLVAFGVLGLTLAGHLLITGDTYRQRRNGVLLLGLFWSIVLLPVLALFAPIAGAAFSVITIAVLRRRGTET